MKKNIVLLGLIIIFFVSAYYFNKYRTNSLQNHYRFSIAEVTSDFHYKNWNGTGSDFIYYVKNKKYKGGVNSRNVIKGTKYLIAYDNSGKTNRTEFFENIIIPENIKPPIEGWSLEEIPFNVDTVFIKKKLEKL